MSGTNETCEYVLDPDDPETWDGEVGDDCYINERVLNENDVWSCPYDTNEGNKYCIFHLPIKDKDNEEVIDSFKDVLDKKADNQDRIEIVGGEFGKLVFNQGEFLVIGGVTINADVHMSHTSFHRQCDFSSSEFNGKAIFSGCEFNSISNFERAEFNQKAAFRGVEFKRETNFESADFDSEADFSHAIFNRNSNFQWVDFGEKAGFYSAKFEGIADFEHATFYDVVRFFDVDFMSDANFWESTFNKGRFRASFYDLANFRLSKFINESRFKESEFREKADFRCESFGQSPNFEECNLTDADFRGTNLEQANFYKSVLNGVDFSESNLTNANLELAQLSQTTLFNVDLRGARLAGAVLASAQINEKSRFLGVSEITEDGSEIEFSKDSGFSSDAFDEIEIDEISIGRDNKNEESPDANNILPPSLFDIHPRLTCVYDPDYEGDNEHEDVDKAKSVYRALEELGGKHARPQLQARSFVRRQDLQKKDYWDDATADDASLKERLITGARWSRAKVARTTLLYGESPWRVIAWSLGIILFFAFSYPAVGGMKPEGGDPITYAQIVANPIEIFTLIYYSTLTYTALGFGDFQPVGLGRLLTTVETGLGAVMLALLVFILVEGRRDNTGGVWKQTNPFRLQEVMCVIQSSRSLTPRVISSVINRGTQCISDD